MISEIIITGFLICLILQLYWNYSRKVGNAPSFYSFPLLGHLPFLVKYKGTGIHGACTEWSKIYGPIFRVDLGSFSNFIINDYRLIKEAWNVPELCGRLLVAASSIRMGNDGNRRGIVNNTGAGWTEQRRFTMRQLKDFGLGKSGIMETIILDECTELIETFKKTNGLPVTTQSKFNAAIINTLWTIVAGHRFSHDDPKLAKLVEYVTHQLTETGGTMIFLFMPTLAQMFPRLSGWKGYVDSYQFTHRFMEDFVQSRLNTYKEGIVQDFTDAYIAEIKKTNDTQSSFYKEEGIKSMLTNLEDIFSAGGETTSTSLTWILLCISLHPTVQEKLHYEIDTLVGRERFPSLKDRHNMLYTEAVICEALRKSSVFPLSVPHCAEKDITFNGIQIPEGSIISSNLYAAHHDVSYWGDPEVFRPERFLSPDGKHLVKHEAFLPFSFGKRVCPGENLVRMELFMMIVCLYQVFKIIPDPNSPRPTMEGQTNGLVTTTRPHKLVFLKR